MQRLSIDDLLVRDLRVEGGDAAAALEKEAVGHPHDRGLMRGRTLRRLSRRASMNAYSAMRVQPFSVNTLSVSTTPGTTSCSSPEYSPSVFSRR
jgi:hypothetical protein